MATDFIQGDYEFVEYELDSLSGATVGTNGYSLQNWPTFKLARPLRDVMAVKVMEAGVPFSYYMFRTGNNQFILDENPTQFTVTIPQGNYTSVTIPAALQTALNTCGTARTYTVVYSDATQKLTITNTAAAQFSLIFGTSSDLGITNPRIWLGFNPGTNGPYTTASGGTSPNVVKLSGYDFLYLNSKKLGAQCDVFLPKTTIIDGNFSPVLAKIPVLTNSGGITNWQDPANPYFFVVDDLYNLSEIDFYFTEPVGNTIVDFNGLGFNIKLAIMLKQDTQTVNQTSQFLRNRVVKRIRQK